MSIVTLVVTYLLLSNNNTYIDHMNNSYTNIKNTTKAMANTSVNPNSAEASKGKLKAILDKVQKKDIKSKQPAKPNTALPLQNKMNGYHQPSKIETKPTNKNSINKPVSNQVQNSPMYWSETADGVPQYK